MKQVKATKAHNCVECNKPIQVGELYLYEAGRAAIHNDSGQKKGYAYWNIKKHIKDCRSNE